MHGADDLPEILDTERSPKISKNLQQNPAPVAAIRQLPQIAQWFLWTSNRLFNSAEFVAESYQQLTVTLSLERW